MYTDRNITYADPGKYLKSKNNICFQGSSNVVYEELPLELNDMHIKNGVVFYNTDLCAQFIVRSWTYADYKREFIKKRYSNDDQIAIILNKDDSEEDLQRYNRMMEWRKFASLMANKIMNLFDK